MKKLFLSYTKTEYRKILTNRPAVMQGFLFIMAGLMSILAWFAKRQKDLNSYY